MNQLDKLVAAIKELQEDRIYKILKFIGFYRG